MSQFQVYTEYGNSEPFDDLEEAKQWAHESNCWFEVVDLVKADVIYTAEDYEFSIYHMETA